MNVYFCDQCGESVPLTDLERGIATVSGDRVLCEKCRPPSLVHRTGIAFWLVAALFGGVVGAVAGSIAGAWLVRGRAASTPSEGIAPLSASAPQAIARLEDAVEDLRGTLDRIEARAGADSPPRPNESGGISKSLEERLDALERRLPASRNAPEESGVTEELSNRFLAVEIRLLALEKSVSELETSGPLRFEAGSPSSALAPPTSDAPLEAESADVRARFEGLLARLAESDPGVRWQAVEGLTETADARAVPYLLQAAADPDPFVRFQATKGLGLFGDRSAVPLLLKALEDEEEIVRESAYESLRLLTLESIPFDPAASLESRTKAIGHWREWWGDQERSARGN